MGDHFDPPFGPFARTAENRERERVAIGAYNFARSFIEQVLVGVREPYRIRKAILHSTQDDIIRAIEASDNRLEAGIDTWTKEQGIERVREFVRAAERDWSDRNGK